MLGGARKLGHHGRHHAVDAQVVNHVAVEIRGNLIGTRHRGDHLAVDAKELIEARDYDLLVHGLVVASNEVAVQVDVEVADRAHQRQRRSSHSTMAHVRMGANRADRSA